MGVSGVASWWSLCASPWCPEGFGWRRGGCALSHPLPQPLMVGELSKQRWGNLINPERSVTKSPSELAMQLSEHQGGFPSRTLIPSANKPRGGAQPVSTVGLGQRVRTWRTFGASPQGADPHHPAPAASLGALLPSFALWVFFFFFERCFGAISAMLHPSLGVAQSFPVPYWMDWGGQHQSLSHVDLLFQHVEHL